MKNRRTLWCLVLVCIALFGYKLNFELAYAQKKMEVSGRVFSKVDGKHVAGASVTMKGSHYASISDSLGNFTILIDKSKGVLEIRHVAYQTYKKTFDGSSEFLLVNMLPVDNQIKEVEVVNTGYYLLPKERVTGSFDNIGEEQLQRFPFTNLIDRLEGVTNGLLVDRSNSSNERVGVPKLRLRGLSTIESNSEPLIVLDGFIYDGSLSTIAPSDIQSVTVLKDAAAASIWGAKAGNGVLVINTKRGRVNEKVSVSVLSATQLQDKPDLYYSKNYLPSSAVLEIEERMFDKNNYRERNQTAIPLYTEWLIKHRDNKIDADQLAEIRDVFEKTDTREQSLKYLYRKGINQHYNTSIQGGGERYSFRSSISYDKDRSFIVENQNYRWNAGHSGTVHLGSNFSVSPSIWYTEQGSQNNGQVFTNFSGGGVSVVPYYRLRDEEGKALAVVGRNLRYAYQETAPELGLLDWMYRPLDEMSLVDNIDKERETRLQTIFNYKWKKWLGFMASYQYVYRQSLGYALYDRESYYVRDLVNRFTQSNGDQVIPFGGIKRHAAQQSGNNHSGRFQAEGEYKWGEEHSLNYIAGTEILSQQTKTTPYMMVYDYDKDLLTGRSNFNYLQRYNVRPSGTGLIAGSGGGEGERVHRFISYYSNASYDFKNTYLLSGSIRWDASNIYGVKVNQRGVPLWSIGTAWRISKEPFFSKDLFQEIKLRTTYGSSGNTNPDVTTYPIISYDVDPITNVQSAYLRSVGNPSLSWEKVNILNLGVDFNMVSNRVRGSIEYYFKRANNLIGVDYMDPTSGIAANLVPRIVNRINYANLATNGWEVQLHTDNIRGTFLWTTSLLMSGVQNKVTNYATSDITAAYTFIPQRPPVLGQSLDVIYAFPWSGLNDKGKPVIYKDNTLSDDYINYFNNYQIEDLVRVGSRIPKLTANLANSFKWKSIHAGIGLAWKSGYYFQRTTMDPLGETNGNYHQDYFRRWEKSGDEYFTDVLPQAEAASPELTAIVGMYSLSEHLWEKGDHLRIRDVSLGYDFGDIDRLSYFKGISLRVSATNLGLIWRKNKIGIDPDYANSTYTAPRLYSFSFSANF